MADKIARDTIFNAMGNAGAVVVTRATARTGPLTEKNLQTDILLGFNEAWKVILPWTEDDDGPRTTDVLLREWLQARANIMLGQLSAKSFGQHWVALTQMFKATFNVAEFQSARLLSDQSTGIDHDARNATIRLCELLFAACAQGQRFGTPPAVSAVDGGGVGEDSVAGHTDVVG